MFSKCTSWHAHLLAGYAHPPYSIHSHCTFLSDTSRPGCSQNAPLGAPTVRPGMPNIHRASSANPPFLGGVHFYAAGPVAAPKQGYPLPRAPVWVINFPRSGLVLQAPWAVPRGGSKWYAIRCSLNIPRGLGVLKTHLLAHPPSGRICPPSVQHPLTLHLPW